jgi:hypothetical protein
VAELRKQHVVVVVDPETKRAAIGPLCRSILSLNSGAQGRADQGQLLRQEAAEGRSRRLQPDQQESRAWFRVAVAAPAFSSCGAAFIFLLTSINPLCLVDRARPRPRLCPRLALGFIQFSRTVFLFVVNSVGWR